MILFGHGFLRSNFMKGSPLFKTAGHSQVNRTANVLKYIQGLGCRVIKSTIANGKDWYIVVDGGSDIDPPTGFVPAWESAGDQFIVYKTAPDTIAVRGGIWQYIHRTWDSGDSEYHETHTEVVPEDGPDITWSGDTDHQGVSSDDFTVTQDCEIWLKLDRTGVAPLTVRVLTAAPEVDKEVYWHHLADIDWDGDHIASIELIHTGSVNTYLDPVDGATTTTIQPSGATASATTWRSNNNLELTIDRFRTYLDSANSVLKVIKHTETYGSNGRLLSVGAETIVDTLSTTTVSPITSIQYDTTTHKLQYKLTQNVLVLSKDAEDASWTDITTAVACP